MKALHHLHSITGKRSFGKRQMVDVLYHFMFAHLYHLYTRPRVSNHRPWKIHRWRLPILTERPWEYVKTWMLLAFDHLYPCQTEVMLHLHGSLRDYLYPLPVDMRKSFYTLSGIVNSLQNQSRSRQVLSGILTEPAFWLKKYLQEKIIEVENLFLYHSGQRMGSS